MFPSHTSIPKPIVVSVFTDIDVLNQLLARGPSISQAIAKDHSLLTQSRGHIRALLTLPSAHPMAVLLTTAEATLHSAHHMAVLLNTAEATLHSVHLMAVLPNTAEATLHSVHPTADLRTIAEVMLRSARPTVVLPTTAEVHTVDKLAATAGQHLATEGQLRATIGQAAATTGHLATTIDQLAATAGKEAATARAVPPTVAHLLTKAGRATTARDQVAIAKINHISVATTPLLLTVSKEAATVLTTGNQAPPEATVDGDRSIADS